MKATELLKKQHAEVKSLFKKLDKGGAGAAAVAQELADNLAAHMAIEQLLFYPAVKKVDKDLVMESFEEHSLAEIGLKRLLATETRNASFAARVTACKELIEHHVKEEEEDLFPKCEKQLGAAKLEKLGTEMEEMFEEVKANGFQATVPKSYAQTSADKSLKKTKKAR